MKPPLRSVPKDEPFVNECGCGRKYTKSEWQALPIVGVFVDPTDEEATDQTGVKGRFGLLENRNCPCGSTRAIAIGFEELVFGYNAMCVRVRRAMGALTDIREMTSRIPEVVCAVPGAKRPPEPHDVLIEREMNAQVAESIGSELRKIASSRPGVAMGRELHARADLCDEIASGIRSRT